MNLIESNQTKVARLLEALQRDHPRVYVGLVNKFNPPGAGLNPTGNKQLSGLMDFVSSTVGKVTDFVNSQGFDKLLQTAQPFLQNELQKNQLALQIKAAAAGVPVPSNTQANKQIAQQQGGALPAGGGFFDRLPPWALPVGIAGLIGVALWASGAFRRRRRA